MRLDRISPVGLAFLTLVIVSGAVWARPTPPDDPFRADAITDPAMTSITYALHTFAWFNPLTDVHMYWVRQANFSHAKQIFPWNEIQPLSNQYNPVFDGSDRVVSAANRAGVELVVRLSDAPEWSHRADFGEKNVDYHDAPPDNGHFHTFCFQVAERYRGQIDAYQVWNEPNLSREWGGQPPNAAEYVELLAACSSGIRRGDPDAIIISAGLAPTGNYDATAIRDDIFLQQMYDAGFQQYVDMVGVHAPGFSDVTYGPDDAERDGRGRWATFRRVEDMREIMVANDDAGRQMAILEMGWTVADEERHPEYAWFAVDEETQAENLVEAYAYIADNWRPWVGLVTTIYLSDPAWDESNEEMFFAITLPNGWARPALQALSNMPKYCGEHVIPRRDGGSPEALGIVRTSPCR
jgi:hypothetical protein